MDNFFTGYRRVPLSKLVQLPGEHPPTLRSLQKDLAIFAIRRGDIRLFSYLCWDLLRFQRDFRRYGLEADTSPQDPESGQASAKAKGG
jgi:hypothetical protein